MMPVYFCNKCKFNHTFGKHCEDYCTGRVIACKNPHSKSANSAGPWYAANPGNHQRVIISESTGENIAISYEKNNANLIAAAPELLAACELVDRACTGDGVHISTALDACLLAIAKTKGEQ